MKPIEELNSISHMLPTEVLKDIHTRINDWMASGGDINDPYIEQQLRFAKKVISKQRVREN